MGRPEIDVFNVVPPDARVGVLMHRYVSPLPPKRVQRALRCSVEVEDALRWMTHAFRVYPQLIRRRRRQIAHVTYFIIHGHAFR